LSDWIIGVVKQMGYLGIAFLTFLENVFPPIPSELIMPLAGFVSEQGGMNIGGAIAAGSVGSLAGAFAWYYVGRMVGEERLRKWVDNHGKWLTLSCEDLDRSKDWFSRHGAAVIFFGRLIPGIRTFISVPAGLDKMPVWQFTLYSAAGTVIWTAALTYAGYLLRHNFEDVKTVIGPVSTAVFAIILAWYFYRLVRQWRTSE
jgi:membrane protein DedA with SNARE-associated domain